MKKLSLILIDWNVRESYHSVDFLCRQSVPREEYEIIWVEYYDHRPSGIADRVARGDIDRWIVLEKTGMYFKHVMYNEGLLAATGDYVVVCDSDAVFSPRFVESVLKAFQEQGAETVLYFEEVRSDNRSFYPFKGHTWDEIMKAPGLMNWDPQRGRPKGLTTSHDPIHNRNYGACFCAERQAMINAGGFDESASYHCFMCGPYELGWRLVNRGFQEIWHSDEWLLHTWHPWVKPETEVFGEHDGRGVNALALEARKTGRLLPCVENAAIRALRHGTGDSIAFDVPAPRMIQQKSAISLTRIPWVEKVLLVTEFDPHDTLRRTLESTGLVCDIETFYFDQVYHRFGQAVMEAQLLMVAKHFAPHLVVYRPLATDFAAGGEDSVEPNITIIQAIASMGTVVYVHEPPPSRTLEIPSAVPRTYPDVNPEIFCDPSSERDSDVTFWGSVGVGGGREDLLRDLSRRGVSVVTRPYRVSAETYAGILARSKIALSLPRPELCDSAPSRRALEILSCGALMMEPEGGASAQHFIAGREYIAYQSVEDLAEKIRYYLQHEDQCMDIADAGRRKADGVFGARKMWKGIFRACGFAPLFGGLLRNMQKIAFQSGIGKKMSVHREAEKISRIRRAAIFGAGPSGEQCRRRIQAMGIEPRFFVDNDTERQGKNLGGLPIHPIAFLADQNEVDGVVLAFQGSKTFSCYQLAEIGYRGEVIDFDLIAKS